MTISLCVRRYELEQDGELDAETKEQLESFYATIKDDEYDIIAQVYPHETRMRARNIYKCACGWSRRDRGGREEDRLIARTSHSLRS